MAKAIIINQDGSVFKTLSLEELVGVKLDVGQKVIIDNEVVVSPEELILDSDNVIVAINLSKDNIQTKENSENKDTERSFKNDEIISKLNDSSKSIKDANLNNTKALESGKKSVVETKIEDELIVKPEVIEDKIDEKEIVKATEEAKIAQAKIDAKLKLQEQEEAVKIAKKVAQEEAAKKAAAARAAAQAQAEEDLNEAMNFLDGLSDEFDTSNLNVDSQNELLSILTTSLQDILKVAKSYEGDDAIKAKDYDTLSKAESSVNQALIDTENSLNEAKKAKELAQDAKDKAQDVVAQAQDVFNKAKIASTNVSGASDILEGAKEKLALANEKLDEINSNIKSLEIQLDTLKVLQNTIEAKTDAIVKDAIDSVQQIKANLEIANETLALKQSNYETLLKANAQGADNQEALDVAFKELKDIKSEVKTLSTDLKLNVNILELSAKAAGETSLNNDNSSENTIEQLVQESASSVEQTKVAVAAADVVSSASLTPTLSSIEQLGIQDTSDEILDELGGILKEIVIDNLVSDNETTTIDSAVMQSAVDVLNFANNQDLQKGSEINLSSSLENLTGTNLSDTTTSLVANSISNLNGTKLTLNQTNLSNETSIKELVSSAQKLEQIISNSDSSVDITVEEISNFVNGVDSSNIDDIINMLANSGDTQVLLDLQSKVNETTGNTIENIMQNLDSFTVKTSTFVNSGIDITSDNTQALIDNLQAFSDNQPENSASLDTVANSLATILNQNDTSIVKKATAEDYNNIFGDTINVSDTSAQLVNDVIKNSSGDLNLENLLTTATTLETLLNNSDLNIAIDDTTGEAVITNQDGTTTTLNVDEVSPFINGVTTDNLLEKLNFITTTGMLNEKPSLEDIVNLANDINGTEPTASDYENLTDIKLTTSEVELLNEAMTNDTLEINLETLTNLSSTLNTLSSIASGESVVKEIVNEDGTKSIEVTDVNTTETTTIKAEELTNLGFKSINDENINDVLNDISSNGTIKNIQDIVNDINGTTDKFENIATQTVTTQDYINSGVSGVDDTNKDKVNSLLEELVTSDTTISLTQDTLQAISDIVNYDGTGKTLTSSTYEEIIPNSNLSKDETKATNEILTKIDSPTISSIKDITEVIKTLSDIANDVVTIEDSNIAVDDLNLLNIDGVNEQNLNDILTSIKHNGAVSEIPETIAFESYKYQSSQSEALSKDVTTLNELLTTAQDDFNTALTTAQDNPTTENIVASQTAYTNLKTALDNTNGVVQTFTTSISTLKSLGDASTTVTSDTLTDEINNLNNTSTTLSNSIDGVNSIANSAPIFATSSLLVDSSGNFDDIHALDIEGDSLTYTIGNLDNLSGRLYLADGTKLSQGDSVSASDIDTLLYKTLVNHGQSSTTPNFTLTASDGTNSTTTTIDLQVDSSTARVLPEMSISATELEAVKDTLTISSADANSVTVSESIVDENGKLTQDVVLTDGAGNSTTVVAGSSVVEVDGGQKELNVDNGGLPNFGYKSSGNYKTVVDSWEEPSPIYETPVGTDIKTERLVKDGWILDASIAGSGYSIANLFNSYHNASDTLDIFAGQKSRITFPEPMSLDALELISDRSTHPTITMDIYNQDGYLMTVNNSEITSSWTTHNLDETTVCEYIEIVDRSDDGYDTWLSGISFITHETSYEIEHTLDSVPTTAELIHSYGDEVDIVINDDGLDPSFVDSVKLTLSEGSLEYVDLDGNTQTLSAGVHTINSAIDFDSIKLVGVDKENYGFEISIATTVDGISQTLTSSSFGSNIGSFENIIDNQIAVIDTINSSIDSLESELSTALDNYNSALALAQSSSTTQNISDAQSAYNTLQTKLSDVNSSTLTTELSDAIDELNSVASTLNISNQTITDANATTSSDALTTTKNSVDSMTNSAPIFATSSLLVGSSGNFDDIHALDIEGDSLTYTIGNLDNLSGRLYLADGTKLSQGDSVSASDIDTLLYKTLVNHGQSSTTPSFELSASDGTNSTTTTVDLQVDSSTARILPDMSISAVAQEAVKDTLTISSADANSVTVSESIVDENGKLTQDVVLTDGAGNSTTVVAGSSVSELVVNGENTQFSVGDGNIPNFEGSGTTAISNIYPTGESGLTSYENSGWKLYSSSSASHSSDSSWGVKNLLDGNNGSSGNFYYPSNFQNDKPIKIRVEFPEPKRLDEVMWTNGQDPYNSNGLANSAPKIYSINSDKGLLIDSATAEYVSSDSIGHTNADSVPIQEYNWIEFVFEEVYGGDSYNYLAIGELKFNEAGQFTEYELTHDLDSTPTVAELIHSYGDEVEIDVSDDGLEPSFVDSIKLTLSEGSLEYIDLDGNTQTLSAGVHTIGSAIDFDSIKLVGVDTSDYALQLDITITVDGVSSTITSKAYGSNHDSSIDVEALYLENLVPVMSMSSTEIVDENDQSLTISDATTSSVTVSESIVDENNKLTKDLVLSDGNGNSTVISAGTDVSVSELTATELSVANGGIPNFDGTTSSTTDTWYTNGEWGLKHDKAVYSSSYKIENLLDGATANYSGDTFEFASNGFPYTFEVKMPLTSLSGFKFNTVADSHAAEDISVYVSSTDESGYELVGRFTEDDGDFTAAGGVWSQINFPSNENVQYLKIVTHAAESNTYVAYRELTLLTGGNSKYEVNHDLDSTPTVATLVNDINSDIEVDLDITNINQVTSTKIVITEGSLEYVNANGVTQTLSTGVHTDVSADDLNSLKLLGVDKENYGLQIDLNYSDSDGNTQSVTAKSYGTNHDNDTDIEALYISNLIPTMSMSSTEIVDENDQSLTISDATTSSVTVSESIVDENNKLTKDLVVSDGNGNSTTIEAGTSVNYTYNENTSNETTITQALTGYETSGHSVSSPTVDTGSHLPWGVFDGTAAAGASSWAVPISNFSQSQPAELTYHFPEAVQVNKFGISSYSNRGPNDYKVYGDNGGEKVLLLENTGEVSSSSFQYYSFDNDTAYKNYTLVVTDGGDSSYLQIQEIKLIQTVESSSEVLHDLGTTPTVATLINGYEDGSIESDIEVDLDITNSDVVTSTKIVVTEGTLEYVDANGVTQTLSAGVHTNISADDLNSLKLLGVDKDNYGLQIDLNYTDSDGNSQSVTAKSYGTSHDNSTDIEALYISNLIPTMSMSSAEIVDENDQSLTISDATTSSVIVSEDVTDGTGGTVTVKDIVTDAGVIEAGASVTSSGSSGKLNVADFFGDGSAIGDFKLDGNGNNEVDGGFSMSSSSPTFIDGYDGQSLDTENGGYYYNDSVSMGNTYTISYWYKGSSTDVNHPSHISMDASFIENYGAGKIRMQLKGTKVLYLDNTGHDDGNWHNIIISADSSNGYDVYIDGVLKGSQTGTVSAESKFYIGKREGYQQQDEGFIDSVRVFNRSISESEVMELFTDDIASSPAYEIDTTGTEVEGSIATSATLVNDINSDIEVDLEITNINQVTSTKIVITEGSLEYVDANGVTQTLNAGVHTNIAADDLNSLKLLGVDKENYGLQIDLNYTDSDGNAQSVTAKSYGTNLTVDTDLEHIVNMSEVPEVTTSVNVTSETVGSGEELPITFDGSENIFQTGNDISSYGTTFASSEYDPSGQGKDEIFNGQFGDNNSTGWLCSTTTGHVGITLNDPSVVTHYRLLGGNKSNARTPKNWTFEGSNDTTDGSDGTWTILDTKTNQSPFVDGMTSNNWNHSGWVLGEISNPASYSSYRVVVTDNNGDVNYVGIQELQLMNYGGSETIETVEITHNISTSEHLAVALNVTFESGELEYTDANGVVQSITTAGTHSIDPSDFNSVKLVGVDELTYGIKIDTTFEINGELITVSNIEKGVDNVTMGVTATTDDTLILESENSFNFDKLAQEYHDIEAIDMSDSKNQTITDIDLEDVLTMTKDDNDLVFIGEDGDKIDLTNNANWTKSDEKVAIEGKDGLFDEYIHKDEPLAKLFVDEDITVI